MVCANRAAVPVDVWHTLFRGGRREIGILVYSGLFLAEGGTVDRILPGKRPMAFRSGSRSARRGWPAPVERSGGARRTGRLSAKEQVQAAARRALFDLLAYGQAYKHLLDDVEGPYGLGVASARSLWNWTRKTACSPFLLFA
jgi:hypothetical protein